MIATEYPWLSVSGFGAHIKSTQKLLIVQKKNNYEHFPIESIKNLLIIGGHTINTTTVIQLVKNGTFISFFEADGSPVGTIQPFGDRRIAKIQEIQQSIPRQRYAIKIAQSSIKSRLMAIERVEENQRISLFYEGELEFLLKSHDELAFLIKLDEIRRLHKLTSDMYYEIMSRNMPPDFGFRRRTIRPHLDPINAMLSFGYAMLFGNCCVPVVGSHLDSDIGLMHDGRGSLIHDLIEPLKGEMIDPIVFHIAREELKPSDYEQTPTRCILSDDIIKRMIGILYKSINNKKINEQVINLCNSMQSNTEFKVLY